MNPFLKKTYTFAQYSCCFIIVEPLCFLRYLGISTTGDFRYASPDFLHNYIVAKDLLRVWNPRKITAILLNNCRDLERSCTIERLSYFHF